MVFACAPEGSCPTPLPAARRRVEAPAAFPAVLLLVTLLAGGCATPTPPGAGVPAPVQPPPGEDPAPEEEHEHDEEEDEYGHGPDQHGHVHEGREILVSVTRGDRRIEDEPLRVEVIGEEEIAEKMMMRPGSIAMLLSETAGLRVQESAVGGAGVRIQGLRGRYARILVDGLPLYGGQSGTLALLQIPPMDLQQVEVIKGAASALYGSSALAGVVNLVSRRPGDQAEREILLNATQRGGSDALFWSSGGLSGGWGYTLLGGFHDQPRVDVSGDGWADMPAFRRGTIRPRLFLDDGAGRRMMMTVGAMVEDRSGGGTPPGWSQPLPQELDSRRLDAGFTLGQLLEGGRYLDIRASGSRTGQRHRPVDAVNEDVRETVAAEVSIRGSSGRHDWVAGAAFELDRYRSDPAPRLDHDHRVPSVFAQDEVRLGPAATLAVSARADHHSDFGGFLSPRASLLLRGGDHLTLRLSGGTGYHVPTPFVDEVEEVGPTAVGRMQGLEVERARTASADLGWAGERLQLNATLFGSRVHDAVAALPDGHGMLELRNVPGVTATWGTEFLVRWESEPLVATLFHTHIHAREPDPGEPSAPRRSVPLTPRDQVGLVVALEEHGEYRLGMELYYVGTQALDDNPFRERGRAHWIAGIQGERRFGRVRVFANLENLANTRQTRWDPLLRPAPNAWGRWSTELWAPLEGRMLNGGVRITL